MTFSVSIDDFKKQQQDNDVAAVLSPKVFEKERTLVPIQEMQKQTGLDPEAIARKKAEEEAAATTAAEAANATGSEGSSDSPLIPRSATSPDLGKKKSKHRISVPVVSNSPSMASPTSATSKTSADSSPMPSPGPSLNRSKSFIAKTTTAPSNVLSSASSVLTRSSKSRVKSSEYGKDVATTVSGTAPAKKSKDPRASASPKLHRKSRSSSTATLFKKRSSAVLEENSAEEKEKTVHATIASIEEEESEDYRKSVSIGFAQIVEIEPSTSTPTNEEPPTEQLGRRGRAKSRPPGWMQREKDATASGGSPSGSQPPPDESPVRQSRARSRPPQWMKVEQGETPLETDSSVSINPAAPDETPARGRAKSRPPQWMKVDNSECWP